MNIIDALIILFIVFYAVIGFKKGFTKEIVSFLGIFVVIVLSFVLKNPVSIFLYEHLPFFKFGGIFKGVTALNIALYEFVALLIVMSILMIALKLIAFATNVFEKLLKFTIILGIPSKILGAIVGVIEGFVVSFIVLYFLSLPIFSIKELNESKLKGKILNSTPILSSFADNTLNVIEDFIDLKDKYKETSDSNKFNLETIDLFLKYDVITPSNTEKLIEKGKLDIDGIDEILNKYKEE